MDNYYTSVSVAKHLYEKYGWLCVGTYAMTEKKKRESDDFPFHIMSADALATVERGWSRHATKEIKHKYDKYYIQGTYILTRFARMMAAQWKGA